MLHGFFLSDSSKSYLYNVGAQEISNSYLDSFPTNYGTGLYSNNGISDYSVSRVEFSPDESWLSMITSDGQFYLYNLDSMKLVKKLACLNPLGTHVAYCLVRILDIYLYMTLILIVNIKDYLFLI